MCKEEKKGCCSQSEQAPKAEEKNKSSEKPTSEPAKKSKKTKGKK